MSALLSVENLSKIYDVRDGAVTALEDVSFEVLKGEFLCVVGPSGCGKTTLLRCISGLLAPSGGVARLNGKVVTEPAESVGVVFQDYRGSLYPWMTVGDNVALPLKARRLSREAIRSRVSEALTSVGLVDVSSRRPYQLSGGMQQRVAIARAVAYRPAIMLMDEPFASVDAQTRIGLEDLIKDMCQNLAITVLFVTHDIDEAVYLGDRVVVLSASPTSVRQVVDVNLPRPRDQLRTKGLPEFTRIREVVYRLVRGQFDTDEAQNAQRS